jgi:fatty acid desaturase
MTHASFEDRLARIGGQTASETTERRLGIEAYRGRRDVRGGRDEVRRRDDEDVAESHSVFWTFYALAGLLLAMSFWQFSAKVQVLVLLGVPIFLLVGVVKVIITIRRRGLSAARDGDNMLELTDMAASVFRLFGLFR